MVEFLEEGHLYINSKGIIIPSVSDLVSFAHPNTYKGIDPSILRKKALYGTRVHEVLEQYDNGLLKLEDVEEGNVKSSLENYMFLKAQYKIEPKSQEVIVDYQERYAGRYDKLDANDILWDVKTTYSKKIPQWECQLGLYYLALGKEKDIGNVIWLPKGRDGEIVKIKPWNKEKCIKLLEEYEKTR